LTGGGGGGGGGAYCHLRGSETAGHTYTYNNIYILGECVREGMKGREREALYNLQF